jgi:hypothetical protein
VPAQLVRQPPILLQLLEYRVHATELALHERFHAAVLALVELVFQHGQVDLHLPDLAIECLPLADVLQPLQLGPRLRLGILGVADAVPTSTGDGENLGSEPLPSQQEPVPLRVQ